MSNVSGFWCSQRATISHAFRHSLLGTACLPIPPREHLPCQAGLQEVNHAQGTVQILVREAGFEPTVVYQLVCIHLCFRRFVDSHSNGLDIWAFNHSAILTFFVAVQSLATRLTKGVYYKMKLLVTRIGDDPIPSGSKPDVLPNSNSRVSQRGFSVPLCILLYYFLLCLSIPF